MTEIATFRVMDAAGNTLNKVMYTDKESNNDTQERRVEKRRAEAVRLMQRWSATVYPTDTLSVVACDSIGTPVRRRLLTE